MNSFSISDLTQFTGIKAHTIRIWEKRYQALEPNRSEGNTRYYDGHQLKRLLNIVSLMDRENKISSLCILSDVELNKLLEEKLEQNTKSYNQDEVLLLQIISAALDFNEAKFDKLFSHALTRYGIKDTYVKIIYPAMVRLGIMWTRDNLSPAQEHFMINLIKQKLATSIDSILPNDDAKYTWLLFLPENEFHEVGLMMANYLIRLAGHKVIYLGTNVPLDAVKSTVAAVSPDMLLFFVVGKKNKTYNEDVCTSIAKAFPAQQIYIAAEEDNLSEIKSKAHVKRIASVDALQLIIQSYS